MTLEQSHKIVVLVIVLLLIGCASSASNIDTTYIPPIKYKYYNCQELKQRLDDVSDKVGKLTRIQDSASTVDAVALPAGVVTLGISVMFMSGGARAEELGMLKGEINAIEEAAVEKNCDDIALFIREQKNIGIKAQKSGAAGN